MCISDTMSVCTYCKYMTLFELSSCGCSVELVLPLQMIMKVVRGHLKHVNIFIHAQCLVKVIIGKNILASMVLMLEEIEHTISGILRVPFHKEEDLNLGKILFSTSHIRNLITTLFLFCPPQLSAMYVTVQRLQN